MEDFMTSDFLRIIRKSRSIDFTFEQFEEEEATELSDKVKRFTLWLCCDAHNLFGVDFITNKWFNRETNIDYSLSDLYKFFCEKIDKTEKK